MAQTLDANLNVISESSIEIELLDGDLNIIQKLDDEPNDVGGLTAQELKVKFDEAGNTIKQYINEKLVPAVLEDDATEAARTAAENERASNEMQRVEAENTRASEFQEMQSDNANAVDEARDAAQLLEAMKVFANTLAPGSAATASAVKDEATGGYNVTFGIPQGLPGKDGQGTGDMSKSVYDRTGKNTDVYVYADEASKEAAKDKATTATYTVNVGTTWAANDAGGYTQTVAVSGILAADNPVADVILGDDVDANAIYREAWACVTRISTSDGAITLHANGDAPAAAFTFQAKVVR